MARCGRFRACRLPRVTGGRGGDVSEVSFFFFFPFPPFSLFPFFVHSPRLRHREEGRAAAESVPFFSFFPLLVPLPPGSTKKKRTSLGVRRRAIHRFPNRGRPVPLFFFFFFFFPPPLSPPLRLSGEKPVPAAGRML